MKDPFCRFVQALHAAEIRFLVIGVWGINYYARSSGTLFTTLDRDLFLPPDASNLLTAWRTCMELGMTLWCAGEPLDSPRDLTMAEAVVKQHAMTTAIDEESQLEVDLSLTMAGFTFEDAWSRRRTFLVEDVAIPVASLTDIVRSKSAAGREKDRLFLATHEDAIRQLEGGHRHEPGSQQP